jgi:hypothetical protein
VDLHNNVIKWRLIQWPIGHLSMHVRRPALHLPWLGPDQCGGHGRRCRFQRGCREESQLSLCVVVVAGLVYFLADELDVEADRIAVFDLVTEEVDIVYASLLWRRPCVPVVYGRVMCMGCTSCNHVRSTSKQAKARHMGICMHEQAMHSIEPSVHPHLWAHDTASPCRGRAQCAVGRMPPAGCLRPPPSCARALEQHVKVLSVREKQMSSRYKMTYLQFYHSIIYSPSFICFTSDLSSSCRVRFVFASSTC